MSFLFFFIRRNRDDIEAFTEEKLGCVGIDTTTTKNLLNTLEYLTTISTSMPASFHATSL
jgi:hypothetical protein